MSIINPLIYEHRLIKRMVELLKNELVYIKEKNKVNSEFIKAAVDFFRIYADQCHHGKEENILFRELQKKEISDEHKDIMNKLIEDHKKGRSYVNQLEESNQYYIDGDLQAINQIQLTLQKLTELYPRHIDIEDNLFFADVMKYFSEEEKQKMLKESYEFDRSMIHKKYADIVESHENEELQ
jgi:hemerythrin-like domain-containing protein